MMPDFRPSLNILMVPICPTWMIPVASVIAVQFHRQGDGNNHYNNYKSYKNYKNNNNYNPYTD